MPVVRLGGHDVKYEVRRSNRARNVRLKVNATEGLVVVIPEAYDADLLPDLLVGKRTWIERQLAYFRSAPVWRPEGEPQDGQTILYRGTLHALSIVHPEEGERRRVSMSGQSIQLRLRAGDAGLPLLNRWLRQQARRHIEAELEALCGERERGRVYIMDQRTRWGSCSRQGNLSFNWRLVMAPPEVLTYVVAHEVAHLAERKHSQRFWLIVRGMVGDVEGPRRWLRENGGKLRLL
ncbi:M48 family metallopeptidase [bacterium]|nr:M48 family metallopeptidase [bacterium]